MTESKKRILALDDEEILRMVIRDQLEAAEYVVVSVASGIEAMEQAEANPFDLIILDLLMPQPNGFKVFDRLKELSVASRTPILILTVVGLEPQVQELLERGKSVHHLSKDNAPEELVPKVRELIG